MKSASISEAKNRLSAYIALVRKGETVLITDRNKPVARLVPLDRSADADTEARRSELERKGVIRRATTRPSRNFFGSLPAAPKTKGNLLAALLAERDEER